MSPASVEFAPAKINLALAVTGRRPDGYHLIDTVAVFADIGDRVEVAAGAELVLDLAGPFAGDLGAPSENLVMRAAAALRQAGFGDRSAPGARIVLHKHLPVASGIGGGSADAAAALRALSRLWQPDISDARLAELGLGLGADVPMCLAGRPLRARGVGEEIELLPAFPPLNLVLVNPRVAVSTTEVFARLGGRFSQALPDPSAIAGLDAAFDYLGRTGNVLEPPALRTAPVIGDVLNALRASAGCLLARMSGSGATCFGIFAGSRDADAACGSIASDNTGWWVKSTKTAPGQ